MIREFSIYLLELMSWGIVGRALSSWIPNSRSYTLVQILYKFVVNQLKKFIYPRGIFVIKYENSTVNDKFLASIISFIFLYIIIFFIITALLSLTGLDFITSISGAATSISNVGPGLGSVIGSNGNFSSLPDLSKWVLSIGMILGRLELFAILILFLPSFWKK